MGKDQTGVRSASWLFVAAGLLTAATARLPATRAQNPTVLESLGLGAVVIGLVIRTLPWGRWTPRATLALVPLALGLVAAGNRYGNDDPYSYAVYFVVVFTWVGLAQPRHTSFFLAPLAAAFFVGPLQGAANVYPGVGGAAIVTVAACVLVGETIAWAVAGLRESQRESEHRAELLRAVARATTSITTLDGEFVLAGVVDSVTSLGYEVSAFALFDESNRIYTLVHPRGLSAAFAEGEHPADEGLPGEVRRRRQTVAIDHQRRQDASLDRLDEVELGAAIITPVWVSGHLHAALVAATEQRIGICDEDIEAMELLALHAGRALENAQRFGEERDAKQVLAEVSLRDELTGVGNRRHAMHLLGTLRPGDAVVMIDLDHFKDINDTHGHATGDALLVELSDHLRTQVRDPNHVARYGGEEFVVVLPAVHNNAAAIARRLLDTWHDHHPLTTFSAGVALHEEGVGPSTTLAKADAALYAAKRLGRDRVCEHMLEDATIE